MKLVQTKRYLADCKRLLSDDERRIVENAVGSAPGRWPVIPGAGGARKARFAARGKGRSGGGRLIYLWVIEVDEAVYFLRAYAKGAQADLSPAEKKLVRQWAEQLKKGGL